MDYFTEIPSMPEELAPYLTTEDYSAQEIIEALTPYFGTNFWVDMMLGTRFLELEDVEKGYACYRSALQVTYEQKQLLPPPMVIQLTNFIFDVCQEQEQLKLMCNYFGNNHVAITAINYRYVSENAVHRKERSRVLAHVSHEILKQQIPTYHTSLSYHTIALAALWNGEFDLAKEAQEHFLKDMVFVKLEPELLESYFLLLAASGQPEMCAVIEREFPTVYEQFKAIFDTARYLNGVTHAVLNDDLFPTFLTVPAAICHFVF